MVTFVGNAPAAGTIPGDIPTPPSTPPPDDPDEPVDVATDYEFTEDTIAELHAFIASKPNGSTIGLVEDSEITGDSDDQLNLDGRSGITIVGRNATVKRTSRATGTDEIVQLNGGCNAIKIFNLFVEGANPDPGVWDEDYEHEHGFTVRASTNIEFLGCRVINVGGDGLYVSGVLGAIQSRNVRYHHGLIQGNGRMGVSLTDGAREVVVDFNTLDNIAYYTFDIEPNGLTIDGSAAGALDCRFSDNEITTKAYGTYPDDPDQALGYFFAATGASGGGPAKRIQILRNVMTAGQLRIGIFNNGMDCEDWTISGNTGSGTFTPIPGDISKCISATGVAGLTITGNTQACTPDSAFEEHPSCTSVTVDGNTV